MRKERNHEKNGILVLWSLSILLVLVFLSGCAPIGMRTSQKPYEVPSKSTVIYGGEFELPPLGWKLFWPEGEGESEFAFVAYDEEPFGCSTRFEEREK